VVDVGSREGQAQNVKDGDPFDGSSCILGSGQNGEAVSDNPLVDGGQETQNDDIEEWDGASALTGRYYAYGMHMVYETALVWTLTLSQVELWDTEN
jgi:hypothetical protein